MNEENVNNIELWLSQFSKESQEVFLSIFSELNDPEKARIKSLVVECQRLEQEISLRKPLIDDKKRKIEQMEKEDVVKEHRDLVLARLRQQLGW